MICIEDAIGEQILLQQRLNILHLGHNLTGDLDLLLLVPAERGGVGDQQLQVVLLLLLLDERHHVIVVHVLDGAARDLDDVVAVEEATVGGGRVGRHVVDLEQRYVIAISNRKKNNRKKNKYKQ